MLKRTIIVKNQPLEQNAINALQECLESVPFLQIDRIEPYGGESELDFQVWMRVQGQPRLLLAQVKNNGQPRLARLAIYELKNRLDNKPDAYGIFIAPYISPDAGKICEEVGIGYLDLAGNCLLSFDTVYIRQAGAPNPKVQKRDLRSLYSPKAERILRAMLNEPQRTWKFAELAQAVDVSLGQVANVKKLLADHEWLGINNAGMYLSKPGVLLDDWSKAYNYNRNQIYEFYSLVEPAKTEARLAEACERLGIRYALTSFSGAIRIAPMVRYNRAVAYVQGDLSVIADESSIKPVDSGPNVILLIPYDEGVFYAAESIGGIMTAAPVQVYLDVISSRARGQEAAEAIRRELKAKW
jgi:hypothetical protein